MKQLETIDLRGLAIDGKIIASLADSLPKLRQLRVESSQITRLKLVNNSVIESVRDVSPRTNLAYSSYFRSRMDALHLESLPRLIDSFELARNVKFVHLAQVPQLRGNEP